MRHFLFLFSIFLFLLSSFSVFANDIQIISRKEWGADESLRYADSPEWKEKYARYVNFIQTPKTQTQLNAIALQDARIAFIEETFGGAGKIQSRIYNENGHPLVNPIEKTQQVSRIIIHHEGVSLDKDETDEEIIRRIYRTHTLSNEWGDIAYNYIIGQRGKIYEGRAGGDYVVGVHALYNNRGTVGVVILGDYTKNNLNKNQIEGLERLIPFLAQKYGITLNEQVNGVECTNSSCETLKKVTTKALLGHRDVRATDCPGEQVYPLIARWVTQLNHQYVPIRNPGSTYIEPTPSSLKMNMSLKSDENKKIASISSKIRYIGQKMRVKLSYPSTDSIIVSSQDGKSPIIKIDGKIIPKILNQKVNVGIVGNNLLSIKIGDNKYTGRDVQISHTIVRIDSWSRIPDWDKKSLYNDNLFRDTIRLQAVDNKLLVVNELPLEWYLKGLGEVSNGDLPEKIAVITVAARTYARYYMNPKQRKYATHLYDGSDNPDEFQKYLGYSYELRSPSVAKIVDSTRNQVITYNGELIKPWYHSSSDGKTLSALEYCQSRGGSSCVDFPYLQSVADPGTVGKARLGHGVGISGAGATYFAQMGWDYKKIIQYYMKGVEIIKK